MSHAKTRRAAELCVTGLFCGTCVENLRHHAESVGSVGDVEVSVVWLAYTASAPLKCAADLVHPGKRDSRTFPVPTANRGHSPAHRQRFLPASYPGWHGECNAM